jgi:rare lipoprotein A
VTGLGARRTARPIRGILPLLVLGAACGAAASLPAEPGAVQEGKATWYSDSLAGNRTANGERYDPRELTAAHRTLPFGTRVRVVRVDDGREVTVRINDRGPHGRRDRIIDLSRAAAERLGMIRAGVIDVRIEVVGLP